MNHIRTVLVVLLLLVVGLVVVQAQETITFGTTVAGELSSGEAVVYRFEAKAGDRIIITMRSEDFDAYLYLRDSSGADLISDDDSGGNTDSQIRGFEIPANGVYTILADSFSDTASGSFTLTLDTFNSVDAVLGEPTRATFDAENNEFYFAFDGQGGQIVDIVVDSGNVLDTRMELVSPYGYVMNSSDDATGTVDPALTGILIDTDGTYYIHLMPQKTNATLNGDVRLTISEAALPSLDEGALELEFGDDVSQHYAAFEGTAGETMRLTVQSSLLSQWSTMYVRIRQSGTDFVNFNFTGSTQVIVEFEVPADGQVVVITELYDRATVTLTLGRSVE